MSPPIVALLGPPGCGKGLAARYLIEQYGFRPFGITAPAERMLEAIGVPADAFTTNARRRPLAGFWGNSPAHMLNTLTSGWGRRGIHPDIWVELWGRMVEEAGQPVVLKDAIFPNEVAGVKARGGMLWRIDRVGVNYDRPQDLYQSTIQADITIQNDTADPSVLYRLLDCAVVSLPGART